jgi:hypothetical protein
MQIILLPILLCRMTATKLYNICMFSWCLTFMSLPLLNFLARSNLVAGLWRGIVTVLLVSRFGWLAFSYVLFDPIDCSLTTSQCKHDFGPSAYTQSFRIGINKRACSICDVCVSSHQSRVHQLGVCAVYGEQLIGGYLWVVIMVLICLVKTSLTFRIPNMPKKNVYLALKNISAL